MSTLRLKIALLVMGAIVAMSVIGIAAAFSVAVLVEGDAGGRVMFRYSQEAGPQASPGVVATPQAPSRSLKVVPNPFGVPVEIVVVGYALLIVAGSATVGLIVADMVARPLDVLEGAVESVDPDGFIPRLDEKGLGESLEVAKLINRLSERLKTALESRMRLVAAAGHDLRTPLTRMRLRAEFMADDEEREKFIRDIDELMHIADSAIRLVREEAGAQSSETIDLQSLLRETGAELSEIGHRVQTAETARLFVRGGHHSLKRAVSNLLVNAATHGSRAIATLRGEDGQAVIEIDDEGPGIPENVIQHAFEPFFRATPARHKATPGAGLGLAIAKEIVSRHGGTIALANRAEGGLRQTMRLPLAAS